MKILFKNNSKSVVNTTRPKALEVPNSKLEMSWILRFQIVPMNKLGSYPEFTLNEVRR